MSSSEETDERMIDKDHSWSTETNVKAKRFKNQRKHYKNVNVLRHEMKA